MATEGWGARILALQGEDGLWEGGALFPAWRTGLPQGQPWTATAYSLVLLQDLGIEKIQTMIIAKQAAKPAKAATEKK